MTKRRILEAFQLEGRDLYLEEIDQKLYISSPSGDQRIEVTDEEGTIALNDFHGSKAEDRFRRRLQNRGVYLEEYSKKTSVSQEIEMLNSQLNRNGLLVMLDTTTIRSAFECLYYGDISPLNLLDLAILTFGAICFDRIVVQPFDYRLHLKMHSDIFTILSYPDGFIPGTLWTFCTDIMNPSYVNSEEHLQIQKNYGMIWARFLGLPNTVKINLRRFDNYQDSPDYWNGVVADYFVGNFIDDSDRNDFLSIQTARVLFNDKLAGLLKLPYLASSFRSCIYSQIIAQKVETRLLIDKLISTLGPPISKSNEALPYLSEFSAPFLLGLILEQMKKPEDYWSVLKKYRDQFSPLRQRIYLDREKWDGRTTHYLNSYIKHFSEQFKDRLKTTDDLIEASASVGTALASATQFDVAMVGLGIKLLKLLDPSEKLHQIILKHFKPDVYLLFNVNDEAKRLRTVQNRIASIWGKSWSRADYDQLEWLANSYPGEFLKLRKVG